MGPLRLLLTAGLRRNVAANMSMANYVFKETRRRTILISFVVTNLRLFSTSSQLLDSYTVTPPIKSWPNRLHSKRLISMLKHQQNLDLAIQIFHFAGKFHPGFSHNYDTYYTIINRLARARAFESVESLLSELLESRIECKESVFVTVIRNYGLAGRPMLAFKMFLRVGKFRLQPSVKSLNTLLNAFVQNKRFDLVHSMFRSCKEKFGIMPNVCTCNILIKALCLKRDVEGAVKVLDEMPAMGLEKNIVTCTTVMGGYISQGNMEGAKRTFSEIVNRGWSPDVTTYTILMNGCCQQGSLVDAIKLMDEMEENGVEPNDVTYGVMIEAYCKEKKSGEARNLLDDMLLKKYVPSSSLCCKVIDLLCNEGNVEDACELWKRLLKKNCMPDNAIFSTLIHWLCKKGKIWEARKLFNEFEQGTIPTLLTYNTLIAGMCERGELNEAAKLWDDMVNKGCSPNAFTYNTLVKGLCKIGNVKEGTQVVEEMLSKMFSPDKTTYTMLIKALNDLGMEEEIRRLVSSGRFQSDHWNILPDDNSTAVSFDKLSSEDKTQA